MRKKRIHHLLPLILLMVNGTFLIRDAELDPQVMPGKQVRGPIRG